MTESEKTNNEDNNSSYNNIERPSSCKNADKSNDNVEKMKMKLRRETFSRAEEKIMVRFS